MRKFVILVLAVLGLSTAGYVYDPQVSEMVQASLPDFLASGTALDIVHLDIGQGDATLILGPESGGKRIAVLMDAGDIPSGGDKDGGLIVMQVLGESGIDSLDYFIASHYDADHIGGLITGRRSMHGAGFVFGENGVPGALGDDDGDGQGDWLDGNMTQPDPEELGTEDDISVRFFVDRGQDKEPTSKTYAKYEAIVSQMGERISLDTQAEVDTFEIDLGGGARMTCYAANGYVRGRDTAVRYVNTENERSLCFLIRYGGFDYLLGGDTIGRKAGSENAKVELAIGESLVRDGIHVDVYHANHHGANNGSSTPFLELIRPEIAVISLGDGNSHGHPHADALQRLQRAGVQRIYQTETGTTEGNIPSAVQALQSIVNGHILLSSDGEHYSINETTFEVEH